MPDRYELPLGTFIVHTYDLTFADGAASRAKYNTGLVGMEMCVEFLPKQSAFSGAVALIQVISCRAGPTGDQLTQDYYDTGKAPHISIATLEHWHVDAKAEAGRVSSKTPAFAIDCSALGKNHKEKWESAIAICDDLRGKVGARGLLGKTKPKPEAALLHDKPRRTTPMDGNTAFEHRFEVVAVVVNFDDESENGKRLGSLSWGYRYAAYAAKNTALLERLPICVRADASKQWIDACKKWNSSGRMRIPGAMLDAGQGTAIIQAPYNGKHDGKHDGNYDSKHAAGTQTAAAGGAAASTQTAATGVWAQTTAADAVVGFPNSALQVAPTWTFAPLPGTGGSGGSSGSGGAGGKQG